MVADGKLPAPPAFRSRRKGDIVPATRANRRGEGEEMRQVLHRMGGRRVLALASVLALAAIVNSAAAGSNGNGSGNDRLARINHIVVIYEENHSFDNLYGGWEGVNGLANADAAHTVQAKQIGAPANGAPYSCLYQDDVNLQPAAGATSCDTAINGTPYASLFGNAPFRIDDYIK